MTKQTALQMYEAMSPQQIMLHLRALEDNFKEVYYYAEQEMKISQEKGYAESSLAYAQNQSGPAMAAGIVFLLVAVGLFLFGLLVRFGFLCFIALILGIPSVMKIREGMDYKRSTRAYMYSIEKMNEELSQAQQNLKQAKAKHQQSLLILQWVCPQECVNPKYLRQFISYFENGRAGSLKEAKNLFDEFLHRQRLEQMAAAQAKSAQEAKAAADEALAIARKALEQANYTQPTNYYNNY